MADDEPTLPFYAQPGVMTSPGPYASLFDPLPPDVAGLASVAQGLVIHEHLAGAYGVTLSDEARSTVHIRSVERLLEQIVALNDSPLDVSREPAERVAGNCRHFTVLMVAMLRSQGTPARARCGFGGYFMRGKFEDHWVCEYWEAAQERWSLVDAQLDNGQRQFLSIEFDATNVPRDQFLIAGDAWEQCRAGHADPEKFGLTFTNEAGYWWIAGNLMRDAAALGNVEVLPWDGWGAMPEPGAPIGDDLSALFDRLATLTQTPDTAFAELQQLREDDRLRLPPSVHNYVLDRDEAI